MKKLNQALYLLQKLRKQGIYSDTINNALQLIGHEDVMSPGYLGVWCDIYGTNIDFDALAIPPFQYSFREFIVVLKSVTLQSAIALCQEKYSVPFDINLDIDRVSNRLPRPREYIARTERYFNDGVTNDDLAHGIPWHYTTLLEEILYAMHIFYWHNTPNKSTIICLGSRMEDGTVPRMRWTGKELYIYSCKTAVSPHPDLRVRRVLLPAPETTF